MIHKGLKPFQCTICEQRFREKSNYNFHMKKHLLKLNKKIKNEKEDNVKNNYEKNDLVMENNINNFSLFKNIKLHKSSDISNSTNAMSNNGNDYNNYLLEINNNDNILNKLKESVFKITNNINNKNLNNINNNYQLMNQFTNKFNTNNKVFNFEKDDDLNIQDDRLAKDELYLYNNQNLLMGNFILDANINSKNDNQLNEEYGFQNVKEEKNKVEQNNYEYMNLVDNLYINNINNGYNQNNDFMFQNNNNNLGLGFDNIFVNNYYQVNFPFPLNFEHIFLKEKFN